MLVCVFSIHFARETAGAARIRHSPRPLILVARTFTQTSGASRRGALTRVWMSPSLVVPAKAGTHNHRGWRLREGHPTASFTTSDTAYGSRLSARAAHLAGTTDAVPCPASITT